MHQLITIVGSLIIMTLFISQFAANENTFLRIIQAEDMIEAALKEEVTEEEKGKVIQKLEREISRIPGLDAHVNGDEIMVRIEGVIGPEGIVDDEENHIDLKRKLVFTEKERDKNEESDNNNGDTDADGTSDEVSASDDTDCS